MFLKILLSIAFAIAAFILSEIKIQKRILNWKRRRRLKKIYVKSDEIVFGVAGYDFFDHDECGYVNELIQLKLLKQPMTISYRFDKTFSENCCEIDKFGRIKKIIDDKYGLNNIDSLVEKEIIPQIDLDQDSIIWAVNDILKTRVDYNEREGGNLRKEASCLQLELVQMDRKTSRLIDRLYLYLRSINPTPLEINFKTNRHVYLGKKLDAKDTNYRFDNDISNLCPFMTEFYLKGFVISKYNECRLLYDLKQFFSYQYLLTKDFLTNNRGNQPKTDGRLLDKIIHKLLEEEKVYDKRAEAKFTDVGISYQDGAHLELLGCTIVHNFLSCDRGMLVPFEYKHLRSEIEKGGMPQKENAISYALSLIAKAENRRFDSIYLKR